MQSEKTVYHCDSCKKEIYTGYTIVGQIWPVLASEKGEGMLKPEDTLNSFDFCRPCMKKFLGFKERSSTPVPTFSTPDLIDGDNDEG